MKCNQRYIRTLFMLCVSIFLPACDNLSEESRDPIAVTIGIPKQPSAALLFIAQHKGFFKAQGLDVTVKTFPSGKLAMKDCLLIQACDFVSTADVPFIFNAINDKTLKVYSSIHSANNINRIVVRTDKGIQSLADLAGHTIGTQSDSAVHFFMHSVLSSIPDLHDKVTQKFMPATELVDALYTGEIDAFSMREPYVSRALQLMPDKTKSLAFPGYYIRYELLVGNTPTAQTDNQIHHILKSLIEAVKFVRLNPQQAMSITAQSLDMKPADLKSYWRVADFNVSLEHAMTLTFQQQIEWLKTAGKLEQNANLNTANFIDPSYLKALRPQAVMLIEEAQ